MCVTMEIRASHKYQSKVKYRSEVQTAHSLPQTRVRYCVMFAVDVHLCDLRHRGATNCAKHEQHET
jgi:hypothetical protein